MMSPSWVRVFLLVGLLTVTSGSDAAGPARADQPRHIEFNRDVRPILSDACFHCHGPDSARRQADLRLDLEKEATADRGGYAAIVPGKPEQSELWKRVTSKEHAQRMPPRKARGPLNDRELAVLRRWIEQGAKYQQHWSFLPPQRRPLPTVRNTAWPRNPIDYFVLARLEAEGLQPSPEADRSTLLRRVTFDLTGLPPTPKEVDDFVQDPAPDAYEKVVERLLASPRYGERLAAPWLEAARYADTNGYQSDGERTMWRWRDWVIEAFNNNMPFDQFTIEQIAGDMLPNPTLEQKIATGFNRNHRGNAEGGVIPEEYAVEYVVDRVDTTATVWLGLTVGCARCHDHKYDPISQKEFYQLFAYFNNVPERGKAIKYGNSPPLIKAPTRPQQKQLAELEAKLRAAERRCAALEQELLQGLAQWEKDLTPRAAVDDLVSIHAGLMARFHFAGDLRDTTGKHPPAKYVGENKSYLSPLGQGVRLAGSDHVDCGNVGNFGFFDRFSIAASVSLTKDGGSIVSRMQDSDRAEGYNITVEDGKVQVHLVKRWLDDAIRIETVERLQKNRWYHILVTYDGTRVASGIKVYIDGVPARLKVHLDDINQSFATDAPLRIGRGGGAGSALAAHISDVRIYNRCLTPDEAAIISTSTRLPDIVRVPPPQRPRPDQLKLRWHYLQYAAPRHIQEAHRQLDELKKQWQKLDDEIPTTMVMEEMKTPRDTHVLIRGEYDKKGPKVQPGIPASLPPLPTGVPNNRLGFAKWLVHPSNPLTARVVVNRYWQMLFGTGIVKTVEDFGSQGEWPSHPELLDWLAVEFMAPSAQPARQTARLDREREEERPWDVKHLLRLIVTSATYRQSARVTPELLRRDPENRLLARGPRYRLSAEMLRDQALFASGLLVEQLGGPSVKPYQPDGIWKDLAGLDYVPDKGPSLYRRSLYTFWKRTIAPPQMITFDAAGREACVVRETRTNTPLQALILLNEITFIEAARHLAQRMLREGGTTPAERLTYGFRLVTARPPRPQELQILLEGLDAHRQRYGRSPAAALQLLRIGESPRDERLDPGEHAAYLVLANLLLNLDEVITK